MGNFEDYYAQQRQSQKASIPPFHEAYNSLVDVYLEIIDLMLTSINKNPPARYEQFTIDGQERVGWVLHNGYDSDFYAYILSDGRLLKTKWLKADPKVITVRKIDASMTHRKLYEAGLLGFEQLREMCQSMVDLPANYGYPDHANRKTWSTTSRAYVNCYPYA